MREKERVKIRRETIKRLVKFRKNWEDSFDDLINRALNKLEGCELSSMKIEPKKDRKEIGDIIKKNIKLLNKNSNIAYELADCIMIYYSEKEENENQ